MQKFKYATYVLCGVLMTFSGLPVAFAHDDAGTIHWSGEVSGTYSYKTAECEFMPDGKTLYSLSAPIDPDKHGGQFRSGQPALGISFFRKIIRVGLRLKPGTLPSWKHNYGNFSADHDHVTLEQHGNTYIVTLKSVKLYRADKELNEHDIYLTGNISCTKLYR